MTQSQKKTIVMKKKATIDDVKKWASVQRGEYSRFEKGLKSKITPDQIAKLDGIAFEWIPPKRKHILETHNEECDNLMSVSPALTKEKRNDDSWEFMFEQYKQYNPNTQRRGRNKATGKVKHSNKQQKMKQGKKHASHFPQK